VTPGPRALPPEADPPAADARDRALLAAHVAGDPQAFGVLVAAHRDRLWAVALRTLGEREEAADALQDALLSAYRAAGSYRGEAKVSTWLHRVVVNACLDRVRRRSARPTVPLPEQGGAADPIDRTDPLAARETGIEIEAALAELPVEQRCAILLVDVHGMPVSDVAEVLGVPAGTVKSRCSRGRARLALSLGHLRNRPEAAPVLPTSDVEHNTGGDA
jgi:RNA polymerase sigma-70 factor (ECF subfamily)